MFIEWLGGPKVYEKMYHIKAPKVQEVLPQKRQRKAPTERQPIVADSDSHRSESEEESPKMLQKR